MEDNLVDRGETAHKPDNYEQPTDGLQAMVAAKRPPTRSSKSASLESTCPAEATHTAQHTIGVSDLTPGIRDVLLRKRQRY